MRTKHKPNVKRADLTKMAAKRIAGLTNAQIAEETGWSRSTVDKQLSSTYGQTRIATLTRENEAEISDLFRTGLRTLKRTQDPKSKQYTPSVAVAAARTSLQLPMLGEPPIKAIEARRTRAGGVTLEELLISYRESGLQEIAE